MEPPAVDLPPTRWALSGEHVAGYGVRFAELDASGADVDGEARLADALLPRGGRVLDAGSGMGRVAAALVRRGHRVLAVEPDAALVDQSRSTFPEVDVHHGDLLGVTPRLLAERGGLTQFDLVVCVGNVMLFLAGGTERRALERMRDLLAPGGRILAGFHLRDAPRSARHYPAEEFAADAAATGLRVDHRFGSYELHPPDDAYAVWVLSRPGDPERAPQPPAAHDPMD